MAVAVSLRGVRGALMAALPSLAPTGEFWLSLQARPISGKMSEC